MGWFIASRGLPGVKKRQVFFACRNLLFAIAEVET
jgi:hypothetical protein